MKNEILNEARLWIGTPFKLHGRLRGIACDCIGLILGVGLNLKLLVKSDAVNYLNYDLRSDNALLKHHMDLLFLAIKQVEIGCIILVEMNEMYHLAIVSDIDDLRLKIIHADLNARKTVEHWIDLEMHNLKIVSIYKYQ